MYKLENNVEWTEGLKNAFKHGTTKGKIIYIDDNNQSQTIDYDSGLKSFELIDDKNVPGQGFIGQATAREVHLELLDNTNNLNLENKEFELFLGADYNNQTYYINYGKFIIDSAPENDVTNGTINITAFDYMIKANIPYQPQVTFPCTLKQVVDDICTQTGLELSTQNFANMNFVVENNQFDGKTCREVLRHVGKSAFSWVRIGQNNKLYIDYECINPYKLKLQKIDGDIFQQTYTGNNYLKNNLTSQTKNGMEITVNSDGTMIFNGKTTANTWLDLYMNTTNLLGMTAGQNYTYKLLESASNLVNKRIYQYINGNWSELVNNYALTSTFQLSSSATGVYVRILLSKNFTANNLVVRPQINAGTTALDFEPYVRIASKSKCRLSTAYSSCNR